MSNLKTTQLVDVKVTVGESSITYGVICTTEDKDEILFKKAKAKARSDFGNLLDSETVSYKVINRKTLST